jgi:hypothetical protein
MSTISVTNVKHESSASDNISLDSSGRVGIGTASPGASLDVNGNIVVNNELSSTGNLNFNADTNSAGNKAIVFKYQGVEEARIDSSGNLKFNSGYGSVATAYGCRAWINFDGSSGSIGTGRASGNISSVTDNTTGDYTLNFSNAMPDANYAAIASANSAAGGVVGIALIPDYPNATQTTSSLRLRSVTTATASFDAVNFYVAIFR